MRTWPVTLVSVLILGAAACSTTPVVMREPRLVESSTPPPTQPAPQPSPLLGRWYGPGWSTLDIRESGDRLWWEWNSPPWGYLTAVGTVSVAGDHVSLVETGSTAGCGGYSLTLIRDGVALRGIMTEPCSRMPFVVEFKRGPQVRPL